MMRRLASLAAVLGLVLAAAACSGDGEPSTPAAARTTTTGGPACRGGWSAAPGTSTQHLTSSGLDRTYLLHVPPSYDGRTPLPVVFDWHGYSSNAAQQLAYSGFGPVADREGFIVVAPDGQGSPAHFNLAVPPPAGEGDDVRFALDILDRLERDLCVDTRRVYSTGMSNGAVMTTILACRAPDRFAAFGPVAAIIWLPLRCDGGRPVPYAGFVGTADPVVPYAGGRVNCCGGATVPPAETSIAAIARHNRCDASPPAEERRGTTVVVRTWHGCAADTVLYVVEGGGHTWPGAVPLPNRLLGMTTQDVNATEELWAFFARHRLPPR